MTLLKDLIDIPQQVHRGDFVLKLAKDVVRPDVELDVYVVTGVHVTGFDLFFGRVRNVIPRRVSKVFVGAVVSGGRNFLRSSGC